MTDNRDIFLSGLKDLGLSKDEARIYIELLRGPATHLRLSRVTGINRTKVYRLAESLARRSLISIRSDDLGTSLIAADPSTLEVELVTREETLKAQRSTLSRLLPLLSNIQSNGSREFMIHTYEGEQGFKQMLWHELKTRGEILIFGSGAVQDLVSQARWGKKLWQYASEAPYTIRVLLNTRDTIDPLAVNLYRVKRLRQKTITPEVLPLAHESQICIYNNTVATYHWREKQKIGVEIVNKDYAEMQRKVFDHYWQLAKP